MYGKDITEVKRALESYRGAKELEGEKVLILVSHMLTWSANDKKEKLIVVKEPSVQDNEEGAEEGEEEGEEEGSEENVVEESESKKAEDSDQEGAGEGENEGGEEEQLEEEPIVEEEEVPPEPIYVPWTDADYKDRKAVRKY